MLEAKVQLVVSGRGQTCIGFVIFSCRLIAQSFVQREGLKGKSFIQFRGDYLTFCQIAVCVFMFYKIKPKLANKMKVDKSLRVTKV